MALLGCLMLSSLMSQTGEKQIISTDKGELHISPILHATMVLEWEGVTIYIDPYGGAEKFAGFQEADLILITHKHGDHLNKETLSGLTLRRSELVAPMSVVEALGDISFGTITPLKNGETIERKEVSITAIPMYNLPEDDKSRHPRGWGNGYVLEIGGKRLYISGDTEDIQEMRQLKEIDLAFVCMNLPYTMEVQQAASAVLEFQPAIVYPFHFRGAGGTFSDVEEFKKLVNAGNKNIEVRLVDWYPK